jgi:AraC-like DNA-binding protein
MSKLRALWVDLTVAVKESEPAPEFTKHCEVVHSENHDDLGSVLASEVIEVLCFDFDYPERVGLRLLRDTKAAHPSVPVIMLTVQHSEALALWAFRAKVADYLVKPVARYDAERCITALASARSLARSQPRRAPALQPNKIPEEIAYAPKSDVATLAPAVTYVEKYFRSKIRGEEVAARCGMTPFRFSRAFKDAYGVTFRDYLVNYRLKEACRLLENPTASVTDVAFAVGFNDASYFARMFKQRIGTPPSGLVGHSLDAFMRATSSSGKVTS